MFTANRKSKIKKEYEQDPSWIDDLNGAGLGEMAKVMRKIVDGEPVSGIEVDDLYNLILSSKQQKDE